MHALCDPIPRQSPRLWYSGLGILLHLRPAECEGPGFLAMSNVIRGVTLTSTPALGVCGLPRTCEASGLPAPSLVPLLAPLAIPLRVTGWLTLGQNV